MIGLEAGQSAFGDTYAWYKNLLMWPMKKFFGAQANDFEDKIIPVLSDEASKVPLDNDSELAVDWLNGRRTPDANQELRGGMMGTHARYGCT